MSSKHIHTSKIKIYRDENMVRRAYIEGFHEPAIFGIHTNIKDFYGVEPKEEHPATLDYIIASAAG